MLAVELHRGAPVDAIETQVLVWSRGCKCGISIAYRSIVHHDVGLVGEVRVEERFGHLPHVVGNGRLWHRAYIDIARQRSPRDGGLYPWRRAFQGLGLGIAVAAYLPMVERELVVAEVEAIAWLGYQSAAPEHFQLAHAVGVAAWRGEPEPHVASLRLEGHRRHAAVLGRRELGDVAPSGSVVRHLGYASLCRVNPVYAQAVDVGPRPEVHFQPLWLACLVGIRHPRAEEML